MALTCTLGRCVCIVCMLKNELSRSQILEVIMLHRYNIHSDVYHTAVQVSTTVYIWANVYDAVSMTQSS